jgi:hypothetical protein
MSVGIERVETAQDKTRYTIQLGVQDQALLEHYRLAYRAQYGEDIAPTVLIERMVSLYLKRDRKSSAGCAPRVSDRAHRPRGSGVYRREREKVWHAEVAGQARRWRALSARVGPRYTGADGRSLTHWQEMIDGRFGISSGSCAVEVWPAPFWVARQRPESIKCPRSAAS